MFGQEKEIQKPMPNYKLECPELICINDLNITLRNDPQINEITGEEELNPVKQCFGYDPNEPHIFARECYDQRMNRISSKKIPKYCPFSIPSGEFAWLNETLRAYDNVLSGNERISSEDAISSWKMKKTKAFCKEVIGLRQNLLPGRHCDNGVGQQCRSAICKESVCTGQEKDSNCHDNRDCDVGMYCRNGTEWPFSSTCAQLKGEFDICHNDYEC